jgi:hypothetical protein
MGYTACMTARLHEVPLPPPEKPERERERNPVYEHAVIGVSPASVWVADVHRDARELERRLGRPIALEVALEDRRKLAVTALRPGPGATFVTFGTGEREVAVQLDRVAGIELGPADEGAPVFRTRARGVGFA